VPSSTAPCVLLSDHSLCLLACSYASLFFIACISKDENELITLETIHMFVEVLDRYFGNVSSLPFSVFASCLLAKAVRTILLLPTYAGLRA
jgi:hypothetical protein